MERGRASTFGLIVIGNEVLDGRVRDRHVDTLRDLLTERHLLLRYALTLPDAPEVIIAQLAWAMAQPEPFFCCGGIGGTPDDHTRQCAAQATGCPIARHPEGEAILHRRFGERANDARMRMVDFPVGSALIANPVNEIPGFSIANGHFLPGFPDMAAPMMAWVLDTLYETGTPAVAHALTVPGGREGDLTDLMEAFVAAHPDVQFSSLPRMTDGAPELLLGVRGPMPAADAALDDLRARLTARGIVL